MSPATADEGGRPQKPKRDRSRRAKGDAAAGAKGAAAKRPAKSDESPGPKGGSAKGDAEKRPAKGRPARKRSNPLGRLRTGEALYLVAAILLFVLMFVDWYGVQGANNAEPLGGVITTNAGGNAWQALEVIPLFLMLAIVVAVGSALLRLVGSDWKPTIPPGAAVCVLGLLAALLILIRIVSPPGPGEVLEGAFDTTLKLPVFLALAAALGIAYGGWRAMADEGTSFGGVAKRLESPRRPERPKPAAKKPATAGEPSTKKPAAASGSATKKPATASKPGKKKSATVSEPATEKPATASEPGKKKPAFPRRPGRKKPSA
jgi:hypothetical protein